MSMGTTRSGTTNFLVYTDAPLAAFNQFRKYLELTRLKEFTRRLSRGRGRSLRQLVAISRSSPVRITYPEGVDPFRQIKKIIPKRSPPGVSKLRLPQATSGQTMLTEIEYRYLRSNGRRFQDDTRRGYGRF